MRRCGPGVGAVSRRAVLEGAHLLCEDGACAARGASFSQARGGIRRRGCRRSLTSANRFESAAYVLLLAAAAVDDRPFRAPCECSQRAGSFRGTQWLYVGKGEGGAITWRCVRRCARDYSSGGRECGRSVSRTQNSTPAGRRLNQSAGGSLGWGWTEQRGFRALEPSRCARRTQSRRGASRRAQLPPRVHRRGRVRRR